MYFCRNYFLIFHFNINFQKTSNPVILVVTAVTTVANRKISSTYSTSCWNANDFTVSGISEEGIYSKKSTSCSIRLSKPVLIINATKWNKLKKKQQTRCAHPLFRTRIAYFELRYLEIFAISNKTPSPLRVGNSECALYRKSRCISRLFV